MNRAIFAIAVSMGLLAGALAAPTWFVLASVQPALADPVDPTRDRPLADPAAEARARKLMRDVRCVVCQAQSIDESDADIAAQMRNIIREQIAAGKSDDDIRGYLTARYGDFILFDPPFKAKTLILWLGPFGLAVIGVMVVAMIPRARAGRPGQRSADLTPEQRQKLDRMLADGGAGEGSKRP